MKDRQEEAAIELAPFAILDIIFGCYVSRYIRTSYLFRPGDLDARFRVNVTKTSIPGTHQESISIDDGQLAFCPISSVYSIFMELRRRILLGWRFLAVVDRDEIRTCEEVNYPFSEVLLFSKKSHRKDWPMFPRIYHGRMFLIQATFNSLSIDTAAIWQYIIHGTV